MEEYFIEQLKTNHFIVSVSFIEPFDLFMSDSKKNNLTPRHKWKLSDLIVKVCLCAKRDSTKIVPLKIILIKAPA